MIGHQDFFQKIISTYLWLSNPPEQNRTLAWLLSSERTLQKRDYLNTEIIN